MIDAIFLFLFFIIILVSIRVNCAFISQHDSFMSNFIDQIILFLFLYNFTLADEFGLLEIYRIIR